MTKTVRVGIDVSCDTFTAAVRIPGRQPQVRNYSNTPAGHRQFCRMLVRGSRRARVCLEATGIYSLDLAFALDRTRGVSVMVANPRATRDFLRARMGRTKTDKTDALSLLEYLERMSFRAWTPPPREILDLRALARRIDRLTVLRSQERNRVHAASHDRSRLDVLAEDAQDHIAFLDASIEMLTREAETILEAHPALQRHYQQLLSIPGFGVKSSIRVLSELATLPADMNRRQWVAHAGLDPAHFESGSSINKPSRISRTGNKHLRAALYMPALVAIRHQPGVKAFYEALLQRGKKPMQGIVAVMRKLLHAIWGMFTNDQLYDPRKFYAAAP